MKHSEASRGRPLYRAVSLVWLAMLLAGCDRAATPLPKSSVGVVPGWEIATEPLPKVGAAGAPTATPPDASGGPGFGFEPDGIDDDGWLRFQVTIRSGGSPAGVAEAKLTPLFTVDDKDPISYVTDAFFQANPGRRPTTIQPGDAFSLSLPPDTFVVQSAIEQPDPLFGSAQVMEYTSDHGDMLRYYLTDPVPIRFEIAGASAPALWTIHLHPDLPTLVGAGRTDANRLARLIYRVPDPDLLQVQAARQLLEGNAPRTIVVDRSQSHLDVGRRFDDLAIRTERVPEPGLQHLVRRIFPPDQGVPFMAVEDATVVDDDREGTVVRVEYRWDGSTRLIYRTGRDDTKGKRDPYKLRDNERWAALYQAYGGDPEAQPIKWGPGEASDFPPFPSARDPWQQTESYDFLAAGRYLVLTFQPMRFSRSQDGGPDVMGMLEAVRGRYGQEIGSLLSFMDGMRRA
jgi:hypothetical protein